MNALERSVTIPSAKAERAASPWRTAWQTLKGWNAVLAWTGLFHLGLVPFLLLALAIDDRTILGISPWIKPLKFALSIFIFTWTLAWMFAQLKDAARSKARLAFVISSTIIVEIVSITLQSVRGTTSHFNQSSAFDGIVFGVMGVAILINTLAVVRLERLFAKQARSGSGEPLVTLSIRLGILLFLLGCFASGFMLRINAHTVGAVDGGAGLPLLNWSTQHGDLRIAHFVGLHGLQIIPAIALITKSRVWTLGSAGVILIVFAGLLAQALMGVPFLRL